MNQTDKRDYIITTKNGCIPYIVYDKEIHFQKSRKILLDEFLFKDSFYDKNLTEKIEKYLGVELPVLIGFKNTPRILISKKGNYKLTEARYNEIMNQMQASNYFEYKTGKLIYNGNEVYEPRDLNDFNNSSHKLIGTQFINDLIDQGMIIYEKDGVLISKHLNETDYEYQKYMLKINEMNAFSFICDYNYKVLYDFLNKYY